MIKSLARLQRPTSSFLQSRLYSTQILSDYERKIHTLLTKEFQPVEVSVEDISGGCGSMFAINIVSDKFKGLTMIKQHKLVNQALKDEIKKWHGLQLNTKAAAN